MTLQKKEELLSAYIDDNKDGVDFSLSIDPDWMLMLETVDRIKSISIDMPSNEFVENFAEKIKFETKKFKLTQIKPLKIPNQYKLLIIATIAATLLLTLPILYQQISSTPKVSAMQISIIREKELKNLGETSVGHPSYIKDNKLISFDKEDKIWLYNEQKKRLEPFKLGDFSYMKNPSWTRDGKKVLFVGYKKGNSAIWSMNRDGSNLTQLTFPNSIDEMHDDPIWSPDGKSFAYTKTINKMNEPHGFMTTSQEIWIKNVSEKSERKLTVGKEPAWSENGQKLSFTKTISDGNGELSQIWVIDQDGKQAKKLTEGMESSWSPNNQFIAFSRYSNQEKTINDKNNGAKITIASSLREIWAMNVLTGKASKLTSVPISKINRNETNSISGIQSNDVPMKIVSNGQYDDWQPKWSENGKAILFVRNKNSEDGTHFSLYQIDLKYK